jgi:hypothetical protein
MWGSSLPPRPPRAPVPCPVDHVTDPGRSMSRYLSLLLLAPLPLRMVRRPSLTVTLACPRPGRLAEVGVPLTRWTAEVPWARPAEGGHPAGLGDDAAGVGVAGADQRVAGHGARSPGRLRCAGPGCAGRRPRPSAGVRAAPGPHGGSPHGLTGLPSWPQPAKLKLTPSPAVTYRAPIGPEGQVADGVARVLLAPVVDEHLLGPVIRLPAAVRRDSPPRPRSRRRSPRAGWRRRRPRSATTRRRGVAGVEDVDVRAGREVGGARPGPLFSATKTRPRRRTRC